MCFLKFVHHAQPLSSNCSQGISFEGFGNEKAQKLQFLGPSQDILSNAMNFKSNSFDLMMINCMSILNKNSKMIQSLDEKFKKSQQILDESYLSVSVQQVKDISSNIELSSLKNSYQSTQSFGQSNSTNYLTKKLFGEKQYQYKLILISSLPEIIYKDRNFSISVQLIDISTGKKVRNGNLLNICLSICDADGEWVSTNKKGGSFIKGKQQAQLYHGQGQFLKLSPQDVTRSLKNKCINFVIYVKPSTLCYSGESSMEYAVQQRLIQPLIIKDITIKAKKRQQIN